MRSISRRKWIFSAGFREELKGDLEKSEEVTLGGAATALALGAFDTFTETGFLETALAVDFLAILAGPLVFKGLRDLGDAFFATTLRAERRTTFFAAVFLDFEGKESVRAIGVSHPEKTGREA